MAYWCDDQALNLEQRALDAMQQDALRKRRERQERERAEAEPEPGRCPRMSKRAGEWNA